MFPFKKLLRWMTPNQRSKLSKDIVSVLHTAEWFIEPQRLSVDLCPNTGLFLFVLVTGWPPSIL